MTDHSVAHATFTLERVYPATRGQVFRAWADPAIKAGWFAGGAENYELDFRPGGIERNANVHDGKRIVWESLYREILTDERIVYTSVLSEGDTTASLSLTTVEFSDEAEGCRLVLIEAGAYLDGREQPAWREDGTSDWLDRLGKHLETLG